MPAREGTAGEEGFGSPFAEIDRESDAVAVEAGEDHYVLAARMPAEDGAHFLREENRAAPAVRNAHIGKRGVQVADAAFEPAETIGGFAHANVVAMQITQGVFDRVAAERKARRGTHVGRNKTRSEDDAIRFEQASPQIG